MKLWKSIQNPSRFEGITNPKFNKFNKIYKILRKKQDQNLKTHFKINGSKLLTKKCFLFLFYSQAVYTTFKVWIFDNFSWKRQFLLKQYCFNTQTIKKVKNDPSLGFSSIRTIFLQNFHISKNFDHFCQFCFSYNDPVSDFRWFSWILENLEIS